MNVGLVTNGYFTQTYGAHVALSGVIAVLLFICISLFIQHRKLEVVVFGAMILVVITCTVLLSLVALQSIGGTK
jgi:hypothetical protein